MYRKMAVGVILGIACIMAIHAGGRKDNESHDADNPEGFTSSIPISEKKQGKWNFYIEAKDKAGNRTLSGPENIWLDPVSDLPIAHIINPHSNMRVQGNLNIVGSAIDDDGVDHVEFVVTRGADGKGEELIRTRAEGKEFWSYYLDTTDEEKWLDGVYTLSAWAIDINGLSGISEDFRAKDRKFHQVSWHLDRKKPLTRVTSHEVGGLVSGKINVRGSVYDGNGVKSLSYSLDDGSTYRPVSIKKTDKKGSTANYDLSIDTKSLEDGPQVVWFKAYDDMGTMGLNAHLLFVNNTAPEVSILYPDSDAVVGGIFTAAVYAAHPVGLKSVTWKLGKDSGEFPMIVGNPWQIQDFDIRGQKVSSIDIEIRAEDLSGNVTIARRKFKVDSNADLPLINLEEPVAGAVFDGDSINIRGIASDNDAVASILYSLNSGEVTEIPCSGYFQLAIPDLAGGIYSLDIWAKDIHGTEGPKVQLKGITVTGALPEPRIASVGGTSRGIIPFFTGMAVNPESKTTMELTVSSASPITGASVSFAERPAIPVNVKAGRDGGAYSGDVTVPLDLGSGLVKMELRAIDRFGREGVWEEYFYAGTSGSSAFEWVRPNKLNDGRILISGADESLIGLGGSPIQNVSVQGSGAENIIVNVDEDGRVVLSARREGSFGPLTLSMNARSGGANFSSGAFTVLADFAAPAIIMGTAPEWVQDRFYLQFGVTGVQQIVSVGYSTDLGKTFQPLLSSSDAAALSPGSMVERPMNISSLPDGTINIFIEAADEANRIITKSIIVQKDTQSPEAELIVPIAEARVNGAIRLGIAVKEAGGIGRVLYERPGSDEGGGISKVIYSASADEAYSPRFLNIVTDPGEAPLDSSMRIIIEDKAGNRTVMNSWPFIIDNEMDIPVAHIVLPLDNEIITTDFEVSGVAFDDDAIGAVYYCIDDGPEQRLETGNGFSIPIALSGMTDNEHTVTVFAEDIYGVKSVPATRSFRVSLLEPVASVSTPSFDMISGGLIEMSGGAFDENGIAKVQISLDNGNTFNDTRLNAYGGTAEWFYEFNSNILNDGAHVIFIRVEDGYGISGLYSSLVNVDNTPPEVVLESPQNGMVTTGPISILGQVSDVNLEAKSIELRSLDGHPIPSGFSLYRAGQLPFLQETMDISALGDGFYNIEIQVIDKADNVTIISRNVELARESLRNFVDVLYPLNGEYVQGNVNIYGNTGGIDPVRNVTIEVNGVSLITEDVNWTGYYKFALNEEYLQPGWNEVVVSGIFGGEEIAETEEVEDAEGNMVTVVKSVRVINGDTISSEVRRLHYQPDGAWVTIDSLTMGDFAFDRPWFIGRAGYTLSAEDQEILADKNTGKELKAEIQAKAVDYIDMSFDNGGSFIKAQRSRSKDGAGWRYRLETGDMAEGLHYIIVRANMKNGETAVTRTMLQVDKTAPHIRLITPQAGGRYNTDLEYSALATDDIALASLTYHLRKGDKFFYEVPGFLQGLYFEATIPPFIKQVIPKAPNVFAGGATYMDAGFGLSFFDDNVKIQLQYGFLTQKLWESMGGVGEVRYGGHVLGIKILANIYTLPFARLWGPDWEWLFGSLALGANFSIFDLGRQGYTQSGNVTWMGALLAQIELPKVTLPHREKFRTFSLFTEGQLWFVPTDVDARAHNINVVIPHIIMGLRLYIF